MPADGGQVVSGAEFLLSMVETHWYSRNGDARKMEVRLKAEQELAKHRGADRASAGRSGAERGNPPADRAVARARGRPCAGRFTPATGRGKRPNWRAIRSALTRSITSSASLPTGARFTATAASRDDPAIVCRHGALPRRGSHGHRPAESARHQADGVPQFRDAESRGLSQGAARDAYCGKVQSPHLHLC